MQKKPTIPLDANELRRRAEERLRKRLGKNGGVPASDIDTQRLLHELKVHQIELEMQNAELHASRAAVEAEAERYADFYDFSPTAFISLDRNKNITQINLAGAHFLNKERSLLIGQRFDLFVGELDRPAFNACFQQVFTAGVKQTCEVVLNAKERPARIVHIEAALSADGQECRVVAVDITERKQIEERIRQLARHLETVREEERQRISQELHDDIGQILTALKIDLAVVHGDCTCTGGVKQKMEGMQNLLSNGILTIHTLCRQLRPGALDDLGLDEALIGLADDWQRRNGIECKIEANLPDQELPEQVKTTGFRIIQEALTNVSRHACASKVTIRLTADNRTLHFSIADNGCGMDPAAAQKPASFGLLGIQERIAALGGSFRIESALDAGLRIDVTIPLLTEERAMRREESNHE
jgi:PAS domain S-box-containing protein